MRRKARHREDEELIGVTVHHPMTLTIFYYLRIHESTQASTTESTGKLAITMAAVKGPPDFGIRIKTVPLVLVQDPLLSPHNSKSFGSRKE